MSDEISEESFWKRIIKKHWYVMLIYGIAFVGLVIGVFLVLQKFIGSPDIAGGGSWTFDQFSLGAAILWILILIGWELLLVILPFLVYCGIVTAILWYKVISEEDKATIKNRTKKEKKKHRKQYGGGGAAGILFFIAFLLVVFIDGNLWTPAGSLSYSYYIYAYLVGFMWTLIVLGIPGLIIGIIFLRKWWKKIPE